MTTITLNHISKTFDNLPGGASISAVDDVSLKLASGDVLAILGPSGCGKSTLLRIIAGLVKPDSGEVLYNNVPLEDVPMTERGVGMVFQEGALMPHWEAAKTVGFFLWLRKRQHEVPDRVRRIAKITGLGLEKLLERRPSQLSGGEKQRVAIARALTRDLNLLLFDEPFANLDFKIRTEARIELKRLLREFPVTAVYVTHDQTEAVSLSQRIAIMRAGHFEQVGTYQQLYHSPRNVFVAGFVGTPTMNLFEGKVDDGRWWGDNFGGYPIRSDLPNGTHVTMGIRPEFVRLDPQGTPAVVERVTPYLSERFQLLDVWLGKERWQLTLPDLQQPVEVGATIYCALDADALLYFDSKSGQRIG